MRAVFGHVNLVAADWRRLSRFYQRVFGCEPVPPPRSQSGVALERGTAVPGARLEGEHLRLPGFGSGGPTLEIFTYSEALEKLPAAANRRGFGHIAFQVPNVDAALARFVEEGGRAVGEIVSIAVPEKGRVTFVYAADPEDNLVELQAWEERRTDGEAEAGS